MACHSAYDSPWLRKLPGAATVMWCCLIVAAAQADETEPAGHCGIPGIGPTGPMVRVATGFIYAEGPAADGRGNLYFSDYRDHGKIYKLDRDGCVSVFLWGTAAANGLMVNGQGEIVACEMRGRVVAYSPDGKSCRVLADCFQGRRFNAPNDLVIDKSGGIYFTDPFFGVHGLPKLIRPQRVAGVYYLSPDGCLTRLITCLPNPNGVVLSPDEKTLYVIPSGQAHMMAYPITEPGCLGPGRVFCCLARSHRPLLYPGGDGATVDSRGNVYIASQRGVQVFDPTGKLLGILQFPERPSNLTFGGPDLKTLYVTARSSLYALPMEVTGHLSGRPEGQ